MLNFKKLTGIILAAVMVTLSGVPALAAGGYTETVVSLPDITTNGNPMGFFVKPDGSMDYLFSVTDRQGRGQSSTVYHHQRSTDGGKTWNAQDTSWTKGMNPGGAAMDKSGALYFTINGDDFEIKEVDSVATFSIMKVVKVMNGKAQVLQCGEHRRSEEWNA